MLLQNCEIHHFRSFRSVSVDIASRVVLFVGRNGEGKTSLLEAIFLLSHSRSFRPGRTRDLVRWDEGSHEPSCWIVGDSVFQTFVRAVVEGSAGSKTVSYGIESGKRKAFVNDKPAQSAGQFFGQVPVLEFVPEQLQLVKGEPAERRAFLDRAISLVERSYVEQLINYQRALRSRNAVLQALREKRAQGRAEDLLYPWEQSLATSGSFIAERRVKFLENLKPRALKYYLVLSSLEREQTQIEHLDFDLESDFMSADGKPAEIAQLYVESRSKDIQLGRTSCGVHRDDLSLWLVMAGVKRLARVSASQGQARSVALALKLAAVDYVKETAGESPILLLDDVESELDLYRKTALYELLINELKCQVLVTATDYSRSTFAQHSDIQVFEISGGNILEIGAGKLS